MIAVWSLWSRPMHEGSYRGGWRSLRDHLLSWVLSVETARPHFARTRLVTDSEGARLLVDGLGLAFDDVSLALDGLAPLHPSIWILGKLAAYAEQTAPFLHIDSDVYLWQPPPASVLAGDVVATYPEYRRYSTADYRCASLTAEVRRAGGWLPAALDRYVPVGGMMRSENCGVVGGCDNAFLQLYARQALRLVQHPRNQPVWARRGFVQADSLVVEQHMLAAMLDQHRRDPASPFHGTEIRYLFNGEGEAFETAAARGFTHLIARTKDNPTILDRLAARVQESYPQAYERCVDLMEA